MTVDEMKRDQLQRRLDQHNLSVEQICREIGVSRQHYYNQMRSNKGLSYKFVASCESILNSKIKTVMSLMEEIESLLEQFQSMRKDYFDALKDRTLTPDENLNLKGKGNLIINKINNLLAELDKVENQPLEV